MAAADAVPVDSSNAEQLRAWDGDEGAYWADNAEHFDRVGRRVPRAAVLGRRDRRA